MKTLRLVKAGQFLILSAVVFLFQTGTFAQTVSSGSIPVVTIHADQLIASITSSGTNSPGVFTVTRWGDTNLALNIYCQIGGTASNGVDYAPISNWVTIPAGTISNSIVITSLHTSSSMVDKTVVLQLVPPPVTTPVNYEIGAPNDAVVYVTGIYTNPVPWVEIVVPTNGEVFPASVGILIEAVAREEGFSFPLDSRYVTRVQFFAGTNYLGGFADAPPWLFGGTWPQPQIIWSNAPAGNFVLTAVATDNAGISATSAPVNIIVSSSLTNFSPVSIISPPDGAKFYMPTNIQITVSVSYLMPTNFGSFTNLEFFANNIDLGEGIWEISSGFSGTLFLTWTNPPPGDYALRAVASYSGNVSITSAPVSITVSLPLTNFPPVVRIISPANGAVFHAPVNIPIFAYAAEPNSTNAVASVEFFAGTNSLGFGQPVKPTPIFPPTPIPVPLHTNGFIIGGPIIGGPIAPVLPIAPVRPILPLSLYSLDWSNALVGAYELTAVATSGDDVASTSAPVKIAVLPLPPPPTNRPAVVSIVATDPVAETGTNSWTWLGETNSIPSWNVWPSTIGRFFTNAGPKTATFTVRRAGNTNDDLTVLYQIAGTASNGVDYVALPGFTTVAAGERTALITVVPIDNDSNRISSAVKTVILKLASSTNADYLVGFPRRAAAVIVDSHRPRPLTGLLPGGNFHLNASGPDAAWFCIEDSTNLVNWTPVCTNQVINGSIDFIDPAAPNQPSRFYRAVPLTNAPVD